MENINTYSSTTEAYAEPQCITKESLPLLLSAKEADKLGISRSMFYRLIHMASVPTIVLGERRYIHRDRFLTWLEANIDAVQ